MRLHTRNIRLISRLSWWEQRTMIEKRKLGERKSGATSTQWQKKKCVHQNSMRNDKERSEWILISCSNSSIEHTEWSIFDSVISWNFAFQSETRSHVHQKANKRNEHGIDKCLFFRNFDYSSWHQFGICVSAVKIRRRIILHCPQNNKFIQTIFILLIGLLTLLQLRSRFNNSPLKSMGFMVWSAVYSREKNTLKNKRTMKIMQK